MSRNLKNAVLMADDAIAANVKAGKLVVIDQVATSNPGFVNMYFLGMVEGLAAGTTANVSGLAAQLLGWDNSGFPFRAIQNASAEIAAKFPVGSAIDGKIQVVDSLEPFFAGQTPREDSKGNLLYHDGKPVYRMGYICGNDEFEGHKTLEAKKKEVVGVGGGLPTTAEQPIGVAKSSLLGA